MLTAASEPLLEDQAARAQSTEGRLQTELTQALPSKLAASRLSMNVSEVIAGFDSTWLMPPKQGVGKHLVTAAR